MEACPVSGRGDRGRQSVMTAERGNSSGHAGATSALTLCPGFHYIRSTRGSSYRYAISDSRLDAEQLRLGREQVLHHSLVLSLCIQLKEQLVARV